MKKLLLIGLLFGMTISCFAREIPLEDFAQKSKFASSKISPDGKHLAFTYEEGSEKHLAIMNLKDKKVISSFDAGGFNREVAFYFWPTNDRIVMMTRRITGWLDGKRQDPLIVAANIDGTKRYELWDFQGGNVSFISDLPEDKKHILVGRTAWRDGYVKLQRMNIYTGKMQYVTDSPQKVGSKDSRIVAIAADLNDQPRIAVEYDPKERDDLFDDETRLQIKKNGDWRILDLPKNRDKAPRISPVGFNEDNSKFYFISNFDLKTNGTTALFELDLNTFDYKKLFRHSDVDIQGGIFGSQGELIGVSYQAGYPDYYYLTDESVKDEVTFHKSLRASFKGQDISVSSYTDNGRVATVYVYSDKNPGDYFLFDRKEAKATYLASSMPQIKPNEMSAVEPFTMVARDGLKMYGLMTIPNGKELKDLPLIIFPHGGPYGVTDSWRWDDRAQLFANRGYLVIQLDYRGSGGYGQDFQDKGQHEWGGKMQDDLTDVTHWAINQGYADKNRVCIHGVSYGGYASMQAVVKEPDLYKCSIPDAGPYEMELQWDKADSFKNNTKAGENYLKWAIGEDLKKANYERSPAYHVDKLKAALLIVHGSEDVRVPIDNAYFLENKLREAGKPYEKLYKKDGHGFQKVNYRVELYDKMLKFLDKHIGK